ncbi:hypothetical protein VU06_00065, partial [Desulfobulbus sp. F3]|nr:hypothetical protein [Desulfobulbus sp. F3]
LEQRQEPRISYETFEGILAESGVQGKTSRNVLTAFLHDLGIVIHFDEFALNDNHVLDPKWVTGAVYKIINAPMLAAANGLLKLDDLKEILAWQEGDDYRYYPADHVYIIELMKKFKLCYALNDKEVLIPQLLEDPSLPSPLITAMPCALFSIMRTSCRPLSCPALLSIGIRRYTTICAGAAVLS